MTTADTPEAYIESLPSPRRDDIASLDKVISSAVPNLVREMGYGIGYGPYHYKYASGREGNTHIISLASQKQYISLYVFAMHEGQYLAESFKEKLPKASIGKSCIRFKRPDDVDLDIIKSICIQAERLMNKL